MKIKKLLITLSISTVSVAVGLYISSYAMKFLSLKIHEESLSQVITINELIDSRILALQMCVQLGNYENKKLSECLQMKYKIVDEVHAKLQSMPYTKFYYNYLDSKNTLNKIDKLKDIEF